MEKEQKFEVVVENGVKNLDLLEKKGVNKIEEIDEHLELIVGKYLKELEIRDAKHAEKRMNDSHRGLEPEMLKLRKPEAEFQNSLLHLIYGKNLSIESTKYKIKKILVKIKGEESIKMQENIEDVFVGLESCLEAVDSLKKENNWMATNNHFDAEYQIDILAGSKNNEGNLEILNLVQVKSSEEKLNIQEITSTHQKYLSELPKFIGTLNKKEATKIVENNKEILDLNRSENEEQLLTLGLALDDYFNRSNYKEELNANNFYKFFKKNGGLLNPFVVMGILGSSSKMQEYKNDKYFVGDEKLEAVLIKTAKDIEYSEEESVVFYKKSHVSTFLDSAEFYSAVMVKGKEISKVKLKHPYQEFKKD
jgi:hypothetical protein